jgi:hypothetical protein
MIAAGRSAARAMRAPLRAGRALMPCRLSRLVRLWLSMGCPGTRPGNSHRGASVPCWITSRGWSIGQLCHDRAEAAERRTGRCCGRRAPKPPGRVLMISTLTCGEAGGGAYALDSAGDTALGVGAGDVALTTAGATGVSRCSSRLHLSTSTPISRTSSSARVPACVCGAPWRPRRQSSGCRRPRPDRRRPNCQALMAAMWRGRPDQFGSGCAHAATPGPG